MRRRVDDDVGQQNQDLGEGPALKARKVVCCGAVLQVMAGGAGSGGGRGPSIMGSSLFALAVCRWAPGSGIVDGLKCSLRPVGWVISSAVGRIDER